MSEAAKRGRRNWSLEEKWRIVEEAQLPGNSVAEVARRRGVNSNLLFRWIRAAEAGQLGHRPASLVLLSQPTLDFIPIGVIGRGDDEGPVMTIPVAPSATAPPVERSARPKSVLPTTGGRHWTSAPASSKSILPMVFAFELTPLSTRRLCGVFLQR
ncbi:transposase [Sinorhizobium fredii]|uniref:transposase n=1 Tax=Rhizobium fredii TaxID=380 RepID=UPI0012FD07CF|nr:transposase [Sinorhizobium fredii]